MYITHIYIIYNIYLYFWVHIYNEVFQLYCRRKCDNASYKSPVLKLQQLTNKQ